MTEKEIYEHLKLAIMQRKLPPLTQLVEDELAASFRVSRTIIRAALRHLAFEKLVTLIRYKGAFVSCPTAKDAQEVFEMRRVIERAAVRQACDKMTHADYKELEKIIRQEGKALDVPSTLESSAHIHLKIAEVTGNSYYTRYLEELTSITYIIIALYSTDSPAKYNDHQNILEALKTRDKDQAERLMLEHLDNIESNLDFRTPFAPVTNLSTMFSEVATKTNPTSKESQQSH